ncbi:MAG: porin [Betaproteobacteria bacterium]|nr:porin [Betaproteobacteria bacterium]
MDFTTKLLRRAAVSVCVASAFVSFSAVAADDTQALRARIEALEKQVEELRALVKGSRGEAASKREVTALQREVREVKEASSKPQDEGKSVTVFGGTLTIYGTLNVDAGTVERTGATAGTTALNSLVGAPGATPTNLPSRNTVRSNSSNFGLRGKKELWNGLSAVFQIESAIGKDGAASTLAGRDTYVGLSGRFGSVLYGGNIDSPYKRGVQGKDPFFATGIATQKGILGSPGFNVTSVNAVAGTTVGGNAAGSQQQNAGFDARLNNLIMYRSPAFNGVSAEIGYGADEQKSTSAGTQINPSVTSLLLRYEKGPLFASYARERRKDVFGLNSLLTFAPGTGVTGALFAPPAGATSTDTGNKLGLGYRFGNTDVLFVWENLDYKTNTGAVTKYDRDAWVASASHRFGPHRGIVSYGKAERGECALASAAACSTAGMGATHWALGYAYNLDEGTALYVFWSKIANEFAAAYNFGVSGAPAAGVGADPTALALGIRYQF